MSDQRGITLVELLVVIVLASVSLLAISMYAVPWIARETVRGAVYDVQHYMQLAKIEAVSRNRDCRFTVDTANGTLAVYDTVGTAGLGDDIELYTATLATAVSFARPDAGAAVTINQIGGGDVYQSVFNSDGIVTLGTGEVVLLAGSRYNRLQVFGAGGVQVSKWNGSAWKVGG